MLTIKELSAGYGDALVLHEIELSVRSSEVVAVLKPPRPIELSWIQL